MGTLGQPSFISWLAAWILMIALMFALSRTAWGLTIIYYTIWLAIFLLIVAHYQEIIAILQAGDITQGNY